MENETDKLPDQVNFRITPEESRRLLALAAGKKHNAFARERFAEWLTPSDAEPPPVDITPVLDQLRELRAAVLKPDDALIKASERLQRLSDDQKTGRDALNLRLDALTKAVETLAAKPAPTAPAPDLRPIIAAIEANHQRSLRILGSGIGVACLLGIAAILSPFAARRNPTPAIDQAALVRDLAASVNSTIDTVAAKADQAIATANAAAAKTEQNAAKQKQLASLVNEALVQKK